MPRLNLARRVGQRFLLRLADERFVSLHLTDASFHAADVIEYVQGRQDKARLLKLYAKGCGKTLAEPFRQVILTFNGGTGGVWNFTFEAPPEIQIDREEIYLSKLAGPRAAQAAAGGGQ